MLVPTVCCLTGSFFHYDGKKSWRKLNYSSALNIAYLGDCLAGSAATAVGIFAYTRFAGPAVSQLPSHIKATMIIGGIALLVGDTCYVAYRSIKATQEELKKAKPLKTILLNLAVNDQYLAPVPLMTTLLEIQNLEEKMAAIKKMIKIAKVIQFLSRNSQIKKEVAKLQVKLEDILDSADVDYEFLLVELRDKFEALDGVQLNNNLVLGQLSFDQLGCVKDPGLNDRKRVHIDNIDPFTIVQPRELSR